YWIYYINLVLLLDTEQALIKLSKIDSSLKQDNSIKSLFAKVYFINGMHEEALSLLTTVYPKSPNNTLYYFLILEEQCKWDETLTIFDRLPKEYQSIPELQVFELVALYQKFGYKGIEDKLFLLIDYVTNSPVI